MPQRPYLTSGTLRQQLLYPEVEASPGSQRATDQELVQVSEALKGVAGVGEKLQPVWVVFECFVRSVFERVALGFRSGRPVCIPWGAALAGRELG